MWTTIIILVAIFFTGLGMLYAKELFGIKEDQYLLTFYLVTEKPLPCDRSIFTIDLDDRFGIDNFKPNDINSYGSTIKFWAEMPKRKKYGQYYKVPRRKRN
jgi:hypothetical protein